MPYPTVAHADAIAWVTRWRQQEELSVLPPPPQVTIKPEGGARDWDEIAIALVAELEGLLKDYVQGGGRDVAMAYEAEASVLVHQRLPEHPALSDPEFWTWLAVVHGPELVVQRYAIKRRSNVPKIPGTDNFSSRSSPENVFSGFGFVERLVIARSWKTRISMPDAATSTSGEAICSGRDMRTPGLSLTAF